MKRELGTVLGSTMTLMLIATSAHAHQRLVTIAPQPYNTPRYLITMYYKTGSAERKAIDTWLAKNDLDPYGNPQGTTYPTGTPLRNKTLKMLFDDRYSYLYYQYANQLVKPWDTYTVSNS